MKQVLLDTSFLISFSDKIRLNHAVALQYFQYCVGRKIEMCFSSIVAGEFAIKPGFRDCIRDAFRKLFGIRALSFALDAPQGAPRQSPMCDCSKPLRNPPEANRGIRVKQSVALLPCDKLLPFSYTVPHSLVAAEFFRALKGQSKESRYIIINDIKLLAQARVEAIPVILSEDENLFQKAARLYKAGLLHAKVVLLKDGFSPSHLPVP